MTDGAGAALPDADAVEEAVGSLWRADIDGAEVTLELVSVELLPAGQRRVGYVLDLRQAGGDPLDGQQVVTLEHAELGRHDLFVVPQAPRSPGEHWYAVTVT